MSLASGQAGELGCLGEEVSQTLSRNNGGFSYVAGAFMGGQGDKAGGIGYREEVAPTVKASPSGGNQVPDVVCAGFSPRAGAGSDSADAEDTVPTLRKSGGGQE